MNRKIAAAIMGGVLAAGVICLIVGLIVYFKAHGNLVSVVIGLFASAVGIVMTATAVIVLIIVGLIHLIIKLKNKEEE